MRGSSPRSRSYPGWERSPLEGCLLTPSLGSVSAFLEDFEGAHVHRTRCAGCVGNVGPRHVSAPFRGELRLGVADVGDSALSRTIIAARDRWAVRFARA